MDKKSLSEYVAGRVQAGLSKTAIREELLAVGWSDDEAEAAYRDGLVWLGAPVPDAGNRPSLAKKAATVDVVINFFSFILLGIVASAVGSLYFQVINRGFPDPLAAMTAASELGMSTAVHHAIASLIVAYPLYFVTMRLWFRKFRDDEGRVESGLTKWLTYLVLLVASVTILGDLITILFQLLQGEITARFLLKALTVLIIAGIIFGFYFLERGKIQYHRDIPRTTFRYFGWGVSAIVALGVALGFAASGSPETARKLAFDEARATDLGRLAGCVERYARDVGQLPASLAHVAQSPKFAYCAGSMRDPETGRQYEYFIKTPSRTEGSARLGEFGLCATFALASTGAEPRTGAEARRSPWSDHGAGRSCDVATAQLVGEATPAARPQAPDR